MDAYYTDNVAQPDRKARYRLSAHAERAKTQPKKSSYTVSIAMQARAVMLRRIQILRGNFATEAIQTM